MLTATDEKKRRAVKAWGTDTDWQDERVIVLSFDVEDWFQVENFRTQFPRTIWAAQAYRFEKATCEILECLQRVGVRATFFVLGWNAEKAPQLIREIAGGGHEVASHGYGHDLCYRLDEKEFVEDLRRARQILEEITGKRIYGYRAPSFSITNDALKVVKNEGHYYDSSYNSFGMNQRYGALDLTRGFCRKGVAFVDKNGFAELPVTNLDLGGLNFPWGGGGYFRLWPYFIFRRGVNRLLKKRGAYVFYLHPWEVDADQPRVRGGSLVFRLRHYLNIGRTKTRLEKFLGHCPPPVYNTCSQYLSRVLRANTVPGKGEASNDERLY